MALLKTISIPGLGDFEGCYCMIDKVTMGHLEGDLSFTLAVWRDEETRKAYSAAIGARLDKAADYEDAAKALSDLIPTDDSTAAQIKTLEANSVVPRANLVVATAALKDAEQAVQTIHRFPTEAPSFQVPTAFVEDMLTNGEPDRAKLYGWLKTQPYGENTQDA